jgi:hypothetical protein
LVLGRLEELIADEDVSAGCIEKPRHIRRVYRFDTRRDEVSDRRHI